MNLLTSIFESLVPLSSDGFNYHFIVFAPHGILFEYIGFAQFCIAVRCSMCAYTYGILIVHFIYRYFAICKPQYTIAFFKPRFLTLVIFFTFSYGTMWMGIIYQWLWPTDSSRSIVDQGFKDTYNESSYNIPMILANYEWPIENWKTNGLVGMGLITLNSVVALAIDSVLAWKIHSALNIVTLSNVIKKLHRNLLITLIAQTFVPIAATFIPSLIAWYYPFFGLKWGYFNNSFLIPFISFYPAIDPIVITFALTDYRNVILSFLVDRCESEQTRTRLRSTFHIEC
ncbi:unnamed protein product [Caenorhabditis angaria]|uniref:Uncharacterized protein n=1 Tax=Caenorhabditis angaria TaxID=860376 RepID=A0A9P1MYK8_9PELO|nr:unnamed protein product [Caenorhabditis angaria]